MYYHRLDAFFGGLQNFAPTSIITEDYETSDDQNEDDEDDEVKVADPETAADEPEDSLS